MKVPSKRSANGYYAIKVYIHRRDRHAVIARFRKAARTASRIGEKLSVSKFILNAALEKADRLLLGQEAK